MKPLSSAPDSFHYPPLLDKKTKKKKKKKKTMVVMSVDCPAPTRYQFCKTS